MTSDKKKKKEILFKYQLMIAYSHKIPISNIKKLGPKFFSKEKVYA